jgi:hypothetical protein
VKVPAEGVGGNRASIIGPVLGVRVPGAIEQVIIGASELIKLTWVVTSRTVLST